MNLKRALTLLAKFFAVNGDVFENLNKTSIISWAEQVQAGQVKDMPAPGNYRLTQEQHSFLTGQIQGF